MMTTSKLSERKKGLGEEPAAISGTTVGKYLLGRVIGKGLSSEVRLATDTETKGKVAIKILEKEWIWKNDMSALVRKEIDIITELDHPSVVKLIEVFNSETHVFMAMEAVDGRELYEEVNRRGKLEEERARELFQQLMVAIAYLHSLGVAHRDLKLENLLLSKDEQRLKVTDFGLAARLNEWEGGVKKKRSWSTKRNHRRQQTACGTPSYAAPEVIGSSGNHMYDARCVDVWCAGVILFAMVTGKMPFEGGNVDATLKLIRTKEPTYPGNLSPEIKDLLQGMLQKDPAKRLPVARVLSSPWTSRPQAYQPSVKPTLSPGAGDITRSLPSAPGELIAAANEAMKTAKQAALSAEIAAAEARAAETNAQLALAAAADAQISRSSSPQAVSRNASRGVFGTNGKGSSSSPLSGAPAAWGGDITWVLGRASNGEDNAKGLAASRGARMSRSALEAIDGGEQEPGRRGDGDSTGSHASISMRSTWEQGDNRPSQEHGSNKSKGAAGGVFATTSASSLTTGTAAILARRRLLLRSQSTATSSDKMEVTFYRADPAPIVDDAVLVSPAGKDGGEHAGGRHDSVRDRAERASVKFGRSWSMGEDLQGTSAAGVRSSSPPTTEPLSAAFAASSSMMSNATAVESTFQAERPSLTGRGVTCDVGVDSARTAKSLATKAGAEENSANDAGFRKQKARGGISESLFVATRSMFRTYENSSPSAAGDKRTSLHEIGSPPRKILAVETTVEEMAAEENKQAIRSSELCDEPLADRSTEPTGEHAGTGDARESAAPASAQTCAKDKSAESLAPTQSAPEPSTEQVSQGQKASREAPATVTVEPKVEQAAAELTKQSTAREPSRDELAAGSTALTSADTSTTDRLADPPIPTQGAQEPPKAQVADKLRLQTSAESVMVEKSVECPAPVQGSSAPLQPSCETVLSHSKLAADESAVTPATSTLAGPGTSSATHAPGARDDASGPCSPAPLSKRATSKELSKSSHGRPMPHRSPSPPKRPSQAAPSVYRRASRRSLSASPKRATRSLRLSNERGRSSERLELSNEGGGSRSRSAGSRPGTAPEFDAPPCLPAPSAPSAGDARMDEDTAETDESTEETEDMEPAKEAGGDSAAVQEADDEDSGVLTESPDLAPASINLRKLAEDDNIWLMADAGSASRRHASSRHAAGERGTGKASPRRATSLSMRLSSSIGLLGQSSSVFNSTGAVRMNGGDASVGSRRASTGKGGKEGDTKKSRPRGKRFVRSVARIIFGRRDSKPAQARPRARSADGN